MQEKWKGLFTGALAAAVFAVPASAADYSGYTIEELAAMRGTMGQASAEEREAFRNEWQKRLQAMSADERQKHVQSGAKGSGKGMGKGRGSRNSGGCRQLGS